MNLERHRVKKNWIRREEEEERIKVIKKRSFWVLFTKECLFIAKGWGINF